MSGMQTWKVKDNNFDASMLTLAIGQGLPIRVNLRAVLYSTTVRFFLVLLIGLSFAVGTQSVSVSQRFPNLSATPNIPPSEMNALYDLYNATNGHNWVWGEDIAEDGVIWNFTDTTINNPCVDIWQGISCKFSSPFDYYYVTQIKLPSYNLNGTIPDTLGAFSEMQVLDLSSNFLQGSIPQSLSNCGQLRYLELNNNWLTGTIPESLDNLVQLRYLFLFHNQLVGAIPDALGSLEQLQYLLLFENNLSGTIPGSIGSLTQLEYLDLATNQLTNAIPDSLGNLVQLRFLLLDDNIFTGSIPETLDNLNLLEYLYMYHNLLTGTLPASLKYLTQLQYLDVNPNQLTGTIPASLGSLLQLQYLNLNNNHFTGTIPFFANPVLEQLLLSNNHLHGEIPILAPLQLLQVLLLQNNHLSGNLVNVFDPMVQLQVKTIVLANNQLTGTLPDAIFHLKLETFVGTSNCFEGPLPISAICSNLNIISFVIDGMSSASSCRSKLLTKPFSAYTLEHAVGGSIPICLLQLPYLTTLHLSANGFTGTVPSKIQLSSTLTDLSLSHNALTGSIPEQVQFKKWNYVDLSFNRLSGTLETNFASNGSIDLENNRLSGTIPRVFHSIRNVSMLGSNTFYCNVNQEELPDHDPNRDHYQCGSNMFDVLFYVWLGAVLVAAALLRYYEVKFKTVHSMLSDDASLRDRNLYLTLKTICRISLCCALYSIVILLLLYAACSVSYGTQTYEYAYQVSAVCKSGVVPFALDWCFWWIVLFGFSALLYYAPPYARSSKTSSSPQADDSSYSRMIFTIVPYLFIDIIVVAGVNAAYVYVAVYKSRSLLLLLQTLLSIFKVMWGNWTLPYLLSALSKHNRLGKTRIFTQVAVNLLNNIAIPCLMVAVVSPDCFYNALVAAPTISATVYYRDCAVAEASTGLCVQYASVPLSTTFSPPFTYNYQCSSSLITYYSPAFMSMCILSTFVTPLAQHVCLCLHRRATVGTLWYRTLDSFLPRITKTISNIAKDSDRNYLNIDGLITTLISMLGLVLTFGVMFPPLCVAFVVSICATVFYFRNNIKKTLYDAPELSKVFVVFPCSENQRFDDNLRERNRIEMKSITTQRAEVHNILVFETANDTNVTGVRIGSKEQAQCFCSKL